MPIPHPWHRGSVYGDGPRVPMCRERRAVWKARLNLFRRAGKLTPLHEDIGLAMLRRLGTDGRLDPSQASLAEHVGCSEKTVGRALKAFKGCGLVLWTCRIVRAGWRVLQTSNAYVLTIGEPPILAALRADRTDGQDDGETHRYRFSSVQQAVPEPPTAAQREAQAALAAVAEHRAGAVRARLLGSGHPSVRAG